MQPRHPVGVVALEAAAQVLGEQVVVAEPLAFVVERAQEQVAAFELLEHRLPVGAVGEPAREVAAEPVAHRGGQQELQDLRRLGAEHVLREVLADGVVAPGEAADQPSGVGGVAQRERHELQRRDPAVGAFGQPRDVVAVEGEPVEVDEEGAGLGEVEPQGVGVDLGELAAHGQARERQAGPGAAGEDQRQVGRREVEQVHQGAVHLGVLDEVPVVEGEHDPALVPGDELQQRGERVALGVLGALLDQGLELVERVFGGQRPAQGLQQVGEEPVRVVVVAVQAEPRDVGAVVLQLLLPLHGQGGLAVPGGRVDDDELAARPGRAAWRAADGVR